MTSCRRKKLEEGVTKSDPPESWSEDQRKEFLKVKYHYMTRNIQPQDFYSYLRAQDVFNLANQEDVENKFNNTWLKAGHLIDIVSMKGQKGFKAFMEVIEYTYPDLYVNLTNRDPREPPKDFQPSVGTSATRMRTRMIPASVRGRNTESMEVLSKMSELTSSLCHTVVEKKNEINKLSEYTIKLKQELDFESRQKQSLVDELENVKVENDQLFSEKDELESKVNFQKAEIERLERKNTDLNSSLETLKKVLSLEGEIKRSKTIHVQSKIQPPTPENVRVPPQSFRPINFAQTKPENGLPTPAKKPPPPVKTGGGDVNKQKGEIVKRDTIEEVREEVKNLNKKVAELSEQLTQVQESCDNQDTIITQLRDENDKMCKQNKELEERQKEFLKAKDQKEKDFQELEKRYRDVEEMNRKLYEELNTAHTQQLEDGKRKLAEVFGPASLAVETPVIGLLTSPFKSLPQTLPSTPGTRVPCYPVPPSTISRSSSDSEVKAPLGCLRNPIAPKTPKPEVNKKRQGSATLKPRPLVIYMNKTMEVKMMEHFRQGNQFKDCVYDSVKSEKECKQLLDKFEIVHYEKCGGGGSGGVSPGTTGGGPGIMGGVLGATLNSTSSGGYLCIYTDKLRAGLEQFGSPHMLLKPLPVDAVRRMAKVNLQPIIVFIKHSPSNPHSKLHAEEEEMNKAGLPYETITVTEQELKADLDVTCDRVAGELKKLVDEPPH